MEIPVDLSVKFLRKEKEQLVLEDRTANRSTKVVSAQFADRYFRYGVLVEPLVGIQCVISPEIINRSVETIRTALGDNVDLRSPGLAVFGWIGVRHNLDFRDGIDRRVSQNRALRAIVVVRGTVYRKHVAGALSATEHDVRAAQNALRAGVEPVLC